jgi:hypothetical protein
MKNLATTFLGIALPIVSGWLLKGAASRLG